MKYFLLLIPLCAIAAGCAPGVAVDVQEFHGRAVDATGPVQGATVELREEHSDRQIATITTAADGTFKRAEQGHLVIYFAGGDPAIDRYSVYATKDARRSPSKTVSSDFRTWWVLFERKTNGLGDLRLPG
jgi:hypothetical protein